MFVRALGLAVSVTRPTSYAIDPLTSSVKVHQLLPSSFTLRSGHLHQQLQRNDIGCRPSPSPSLKKQKKKQKNPPHTRMKPANIFADRHRISVAVQKLKIRSQREPLVSPESFPVGINTACRSDACLILFC